MIARARRSAAADRSAGDRGSVLPLVLVFIVVGTLIVLPLLSYSITVLRANRVVSQNTAEAEAVRAGLRMALADPVDTYRRCGSVIGSSTPLPTAGLSVATTTTCELLDVDGVETLPMYGLTHTLFGEPVDANIGATGQVFDLVLNDEKKWLDHTLTEPDADAKKLYVLAPKLPVHALTERSATPFDFPVDYPFGDFSSCRAYLPGSYTEPLVVTGPTYFASGVYYFENEVRVLGVDALAGDGTHVVAGQGDVEGCVDDIDAALSTVVTPGVHNMSGIGAIFVFGVDGRLVIDDTDGPVTFAMNRRYEQPSDPDEIPVQQPSIMTVNGVLKSDGKHDHYELKGDVYVPHSKLVKGGDAHKDDYVPSTLTPTPIVPGVPENLVADPRNSGAVFSWNRPSGEGGQRVLSYLVELVDGGNTPTGKSCTATETTSCTIASLDNDKAYRARVSALNEGGSSLPTAVVEFTPREIYPQFDLPFKPDTISVLEAAASPGSKVSLYSDALLVSWKTQHDTDNASIDAYEVEVDHGTDVFRCATAGGTSCAVTGLIGYSSTDTFTIRVRSLNVIGWSDWRSVSGFKINPLADDYVAPSGLQRFTPLPIFEIVSTSAHALDVSVPGYIAVPQGVVSLTTTYPDDKRVLLSGGILAAWTTRSGPMPDLFTFGLSNGLTQRTVRISTSLVSDADMHAEAVVQLNETGAWAVNSWVVD